MLDENESGCCTPLNIKVKDESLHITSKKEICKGFNYTSGAVNTKGKFNWTSSGGPWPGEQDDSIVFPVTHTIDYVSFQNFQEKFK